MRSQLIDRLQPSPAQAWPTARPPITRAYMSRTVVFACREPTPLNRDREQNNRRTPGGDDERHRRLAGPGRCSSRVAAVLITLSRSTAGLPATLWHASTGGRTAAQGLVRRLSALDRHRESLRHAALFRRTVVEPGARMDAAAVVRVGRRDAGHLLDRPPARPRVTSLRRVCLHVPLGVMRGRSSTIVLRARTRGIRGGRDPRRPRRVLSRAASTRTCPIYAVLAGISFSRDYAGTGEAEHRGRARDGASTTDLERRLVESRLQSLRAQLQPHFLFNALNTISAFTESIPRPRDV